MILRSMGLGVLLEPGLAPTGAGSRGSSALELILIDVSTLTGTYYIRIHAIDDGWSGRSTINVYSVELLE